MFCPYFKPVLLGKHKEKGKAEGFIEKAAL
jgi:hypothetical protein